jgi:hypothetical protein
MEWAILPLSLLAIALMIHGFPNIKIGGKHEYHTHNYYDGKEE